MDPTLLLALFIVTLSFILWYFLSDDRPDKSYPILSWRFPIFGHLPRFWYYSLIGDRDPLKKNMENIKKYGMTFYTVIPPMGMRIHIHDPESIKHVLKDNFSNYVLPPFRKKLAGDLFGDGIFMVNGQNWQAQRKIAKSLFHKPSRLQMVETYHKHTRILLTQLENAHQSKKSVPMQVLFKRLTLDTFGEIGFGVDIGALQNPVEFSTIFDWTQEELSYRFRNPLRSFFSNGIWKKNIAKMDQFIYGIISKRKKEVTMGSNANGSSAAGSSDTTGSSDTVTRSSPDLLSQLFLAVDDKGNGISDKLLRDFLMNFIIAGRDTTAILLTWTFYHLSLFPEVERKLVEEVHRVVPGTTEPTFENCSELRYLDAVLKESLRLYPPAVPLNIKLSLAADVLPNGAKISAGENVVINIHSLHRLPEYWGNDAEKFRPERWESPLKHQFQFLPFQEGPRICLGMNMAYEEAKIVAAMILKAGFRLRVQKGEDTSYLPSFVLSSKSGMWMDVNKE